MRERGIFFFFNVLRSLFLLIDSFIFRRKSNVHWSERLTVTPDCVGPQIGPATEEASAEGTGELRRLITAIVPPVASQIAIQVVRATAPMTFVPTNQQPISRFPV